MKTYNNYPAELLDELIELDKFDVADYELYRDEDPIIVEVVFADLDPVYDRVDLRGILGYRVGVNGHRYGYGNYVKQTRTEEDDELEGYIRQLLEERAEQARYDRAYDNARWNQ